MYYENKLEILSEIFGTSEIELGSASLNVSGKVFPIVDDVIIFLKPHQIPGLIAEKIKCNSQDEEITPSIAKDIQYV